jgi:hypothetical protein
VITRALAALLLCLSIARPATAEPTRVRNGFTVFLQLGKTREAALGIHADKRGWRLVLSAAVTGEVELRDVTPGKARTKLKVTAKGRELLLEADRFVAGHAYRLEVREKDATPLLVYLCPPDARQVNRVSFDAEEAADDDDGMPHTEKGSL